VKSAGKKNAKGQYLDANTGEAIEGEPVSGHVYGREHRRLVLEASEKGMTQEQFNNWVNDHPEWFQLETKASNESHRFDKPGVD
jgi:HNH/ENDO VII superfamily nuclease